MKPQGSASARQGMLSLLGQLQSQFTDLWDRSIRPKPNLTFHAGTFRRQPVQTLESTPTKCEWNGVGHGGFQGNRSPPA